MSGPDNGRNYTVEAEVLGTNGEPNGHMVIGVPFRGNGLSEKDAESIVEEGLEGPYANPRVVESETEY